MELNECGVAYTVDENMVAFLLLAKRGCGEGECEGKRKQECGTHGLQQWASLRFGPGPDQTSQATTNGSGEAEKNAAKEG
jgi:hypothetical protein